MSRISLIIADSDKSYLQCLVQYIVSNHGDRFEVSAFTSYEGLQGYLEEHPAGDHLLASEELLDRMGMENRQWEKVLLCTGTTRNAGLPAVMKFQHGEKIIGDLLEFYTGDRFFPISSANATKVICVTSPKGGTGKSVFALHCCMETVQMGEMAFYVDFTASGSGKAMLGDFSEAGLSRVICDIRNGVKSTSVRIEALKGIDAERGIHFLAPLDSAFEHEEVRPEELELLISSIRETNRYRLVMVEIDNICNTKGLAVAKAADMIVVILTPDIICAEALRKSFKSIKETGKEELQRKMHAVLNKYRGRLASLYDETIEQLTRTVYYLPEEKSLENPLHVQDLWVGYGADYRKSIAKIVGDWTGEALNA